MFEQNGFMHNSLICTESLRKYRDTISVMKGQYQEGWEKGLAEGEAKGLAKGEAKGRAKERLQNARSLKENGVALDIIARSLGLTDAELQQL